MQYGLPYMGSKNKIAEWVVSHFPEKKHFYDLFAGGCAVTHCAILKRKFETYTVNDISRTPGLFLDAVNGKFRNERRWISRGDFFRLKDTDEYVRICWSFGNKGKDYLYSREIEPWKKALHYARVLGDFSLMAGFGIKTDGSRVDIKRNAAEYKEKYIRWYLKNVLKSTADFEKLRENLDAKIKDNSERLQRLERLERLERLQSLERLQRLERLERLERLQRLQVFRGDYRDVRIEPDSLIYCDIPYKNTTKYAGGGFDHESFYDWAERQSEPVIISEYAMPEDRFERIDRIEKRSLLNGCGSNLIKEEGLFVPGAQIEKGIFRRRQEYPQLELFQ